jgi:glycosyltransferase involved in cell wall biosynthesis
MGEKMIKLSILILTIPSRVNTYLASLLRQVHSQIGGREDIEVLVLYDNKKRTIGQKRNALLDLAQGTHLIFIDDDDRIADDYISSIMEVLDTSDPDCIVFDCRCTVVKPGKPSTVLHCKYGVEFDYTLIGDQWRGKPAHTMVWKSSVAKLYRYSDISNAEDIDWVKRAVLGVKTQHRIDKVLYYYYADRTKSEYRSR